MSRPRGVPSRAAACPWARSVHGFSSALSQWRGSPPSGMGCTLACLFVWVDPHAAVEAAADAPPRLTCVTSIFGIWYLVLGLSEVRRQSSRTRGWQRGAPWLGAAPRSAARRSWTRTVSGNLWGSSRGRECIVSAAYSYQDALSIINSAPLGGPRWLRATPPRRGAGVRVYCGWHGLLRGAPLRLRLPPTERTGPGRRGAAVGKGGALLRRGAAPGEWRPRALPAARPRWQAAVLTIRCVACRQPMCWTG